MTIFSILSDSDSNGKYVDGEEESLNEVIDRLRYSKSGWTSGCTPLLA
jgi:hypothetical protein